MEYLTEIINTTLASFDLAYCIVINILTYLIIKTIDDYTDEIIKVSTKRLILLGCTLSIGVVYYIIGQDIRLIINSSILATVSWDMVFKPICKKLKIDYKQVDDTISK